MFLPPFVILVTSILSVRSVPVTTEIETTPTTTTTTTTTTTAQPGQGYDYSQFDEVYDQKQNGTENWRVNVNKVVLVWTPPGNLLTAAMLLDPSLYEPETDESEEFFKPEHNSTGSKRKRRIPGFLRPFMRRRHNKK